MNYKYPKISIITIVLNDVQNIRKTIESVLKQTYKNIEYVIIDGGSTDGTVDIIREYKKGINYLISEPDKGIYDAMNKGIKISSGDIVNMMNSGDCFYDVNVVNDVAKIFMENNSLSFVLGLSKFINNDGSDYLLNNRLVLSTLKAGRFNTISHQAFFYKKTLHEEFGYYDLNYQICSDSRFMYKVYYSKKHQKKLVSKIFAVRRKGGLSATPKSILEYKKFYDDFFGRSLLNELFYLKYLLRKNKLGISIYNKYLATKHKVLK